MRAEVKKSLEGKIIKFQIECEKPGPTNNEDEDLQISSCILVKVTGQLTGKDACFCLGFFCCLLLIYRFIASGRIMCFKDTNTRFLFFFSRIQIPGNVSN